MLKIHIFIAGESCGSSPRRLVFFLSVLVLLDRTFSSPCINHTGSWGTTAGPGLVLRAAAAFLFAGMARKLNSGGQVELTKMAPVTPGQWLQGAPAI